MSSTKRAILVPQPEGYQGDEFAHISSFALVKRGHELLLIRKNRPEYTAGKWLFPSGVNNFGEHPQSAIKRIIKDQIGAEPKNVRLADVQSYGDKHWDMCFVFEAAVDSVGKLSEDIEKADYFDRNNLPPEFRADNLEILQALGSKA